MGHANTIVPLPGCQRLVVGQSEWQGGNGRTFEARALSQILRILEVHRSRRQYAGQRELQPPVGGYPGIYYLQRNPKEGLPCLSSGLANQIVQRAGSG